uniref:Uncharacterized protein n=1 Tax=Panagrolaimus sp. ES5 TaxID=591445 RepID=A0AC34GAD8_9BILA
MCLYKNFPEFFLLYISVAKMNKTLFIFALLGLIIVDAVVLQRAETKGVGCTLCKDFVKDLETELQNDEGNIEEVSFLLIS